MGYIYKITNTENDKVYIGQTTKDPEARWKQHKAAIKAGKGCTLLRHAVNKYGVDKFKIDTIIICFNEDRFIYEKQYIIKYNSLQPNGYNVTPGGEGGGGFIGKKHSQEAKDKMSQIVKERFKNPEEYNKIRIGIKEYWKKPANRQKHSDCMKNVVKTLPLRQRNRKPLTADRKKKISDGVKKYNETVSLDKRKEFKKNHSETMTKVNGRAVNQYNLDGTFIKTHISICEAAKAVVISRNSIGGVLSGKYITAKGYLWKYFTADERPLDKIDEF